MQSKSAKMGIGRSRLQKKSKSELAKKIAIGASLADKTTNNV